MVNVVGKRIDGNAVEYNGVYSVFMMQQQMPPVEPDVKGRLELAKCFRTLARLGESAGECEIPNALSRSYYAVFHVSVAFLIAKNELGSRKKIDHGKLQGEIGKVLGQGAESTLRQFYKDREQADYYWDYLSRKYSGDVEAFRAAAALRLEDQTAEYEAYLGRIKVEEEKRPAREEEAQ